MGEIPAFNLADFVLGVLKHHESRLMEEFGLGDCQSRVFSTTEFLGGSKALPAGRTGPAAPVLHSTNPTDPVV